MIRQTLVWEYNTLNLCVRKYLCASMGDLQLRLSKEEIIFGFPMRREKEKCNKIKLLVENISYV